MKIRGMSTTLGQILQKSVIIATLLSKDEYNQVHRIDYTNYSPLPFAIRHSAHHEATVKAENYIGN